MLPSWWRSGNAGVCKTSMRGFDSRPGLTGECRCKITRQNIPEESIRFLTGTVHLVNILFQLTLQKISDKVLQKRPALSHPPRTHESNKSSCFYTHIFVHSQSPPLIACAGGGECVRGTCSHLLNLRGTFCKTYRCKTINNISAHSSVGRAAAS